MRNELKEYDLDWTLWSILNLASKVGVASDKELQGMLSMLPSRKGLLDALLQHRKPGTLFLEMAGNYFQHLMDAHAEGKKVCMNSFCFPPEICFALDIIPVFPEIITAFGTLIWERGMYEFQDYANEMGLTDTSCSAQRGGAGGFLAGLVAKPDMIVSNTPGVCDTNSTVVAFMSEYLKVPYFQIDWPPSVSDERALEYQRQDFRNMIAFLEEQSGDKLQEDKLREVCEQSRQMDERLVELHELRTLVPSPVPNIFGLFEFASRYVAGGTPECNSLLEAMLEASRERAEKGLGPGPGERARGFFVYVSHFTQDAKFWTWLEDQGITHLGETLNFFYQKSAPYAGGKGYAMDTTNMDTMIDSLADQMASYPMIRTIRGPYDAPDQWAEQIARQVKAYKTDFVCYIGTMACRNSWGAAKLLSRYVEDELNIPSLIIYADAWDDRVMSWETVKDKLSEFLEMRVLA